MSAPPRRPTGAEVIPLFGDARTDSPFGQLTARLVLTQFRAGTLDEQIFLALLAATTGLRP
jgi:hypothetical protein